MSGLSIILPGVVFPAYNVIGKVPLPHRFFRIEVLAVTAPDYISIAEIQVAESVGGANVAPAATISANAGTPDPSYLVRAFDGDLSTDFSAPAPSVAITFDFGATPRTPLEVRLAPRAGLPQRAPTSLRFSTSDDGNTWATAWTATAAQGDYADNTFKSFPRP